MAYEDYIYLSYQCDDLEEAKANHYHAVTLYNKMYREKKK